MPTEPVAAPRLAVIGGGISGLVSALRLAQTLPDARIDLFEASDQAGGKLRTIDLDAGPADVGAEAFVVRRPEALDLVSELGLDAAVRSPAGRSPALYSDGRLLSLPKNQVFGVPGGSEGLGELLDSDVIRSIDGEPGSPAPWRVGQDVSVGSLVSERLGRSVVDRLVDPMLGGVYAATADALGVRAVAPALAAKLDAQADDAVRDGFEGHASLVEAVRAIRSTAVGGKVFAALDGGYRRLVDALVTRIATSGNTALNLGIAVESISAEGSAARLEFSDPAAGASQLYDGLVCALPFRAAAPLLGGLAQAVKEPLREIPYSSSAVVSVALAQGVEVPDLSGILVSADAGRAAKAITLSSRKWDHLDRSASGGGHTLRVSFGRLGDDAILELNDEELIAQTRIELAEIAGIDASGAEIRPTRWTHGLPVPGVDHQLLVDRVRGILDDQPVPVVLANSAIGGVGVPACISVAQTAAADLAAKWQDECHGTSRL